MIHSELFSYAIPFNPLESVNNFQVLRYQYQELLPNQVRMHEMHSSEAWNDHDHLCRHDFH